MTIAVSLKVNDGVVLASDSASSLIAKDPSGNIGVINIYENANKVFNLRKGLPIGLITWGAGSIGNSSISTLAKDLRKRFSGKGSDHSDWKIDEGDYKVSDIAQKVKQFMVDENYTPAFDSWAQKPSIGFVVAGYSSNDTFAEEYKIEVKNGNVVGPELLRGKDQVGVTWNGEPEAINRLFFGFSSTLPGVLKKKMNMTDNDIQNMVDIIRQNCTANLVFPAMPIQDAIDLARFLAYLTINYSRFSPGAPTVGGPIEIAAITKHENFKWIDRKLYFSENVNPEA